MTIATWCILIAAILPYILVAFAKAGGKTGLKFDNHCPREYCEKLQGWRKRAYWAQLNGFEAFAPFAVAVLIAQHSFVEQSTIDTFAIVFILARILHGIFYIYDQATLRSLSWALGFVCVVGLFITAA